MNGYFARLKAWADSNGNHTVETADNELARWVNIRRYDGFSASGYGDTYDAAAVRAHNLYKAKDRRGWCSHDEPRSACGLG